MIRLFTALEVPDAVAARLVPLQSMLRHTRWIERESLHITLHYIGEVPEEMAGSVDVAMSRIEAVDFDLTLNSVGHFGGAKPRSVFACVAHHPALLALYAKQETVLRQLDLIREKRKYIPHVTLGRIRRDTAAQVMAYIGHHSFFQAGPFPVSGFVLMSSRLGRGGGPYCVERRYPFGEDAGRATQ